MSLDYPNLSKQSRESYLTGERGQRSLNDRFVRASLPKFGLFETKFLDSLGRIVKLPNHQLNPSTWQSKKDADPIILKQASKMMTRIESHSDTWEPMASEVQSKMIFMGYQILSCHIPVVRSFFIL
jgi:hypothetical protein